MLKTHVTKILMVSTLLFSAPSFGKSFSVSHFLQNKEVKGPEYKIKSPNILFDSVKFRVNKEEDSDGFNHDEIDYSLRFYTSSWGDYSLRKKMHKNQKRRYQTILESEKSQHIALVYKTYLSIVHGVKLRSIYNDLALLYKDKLRVLKSLLKKGEIKLEELVKNQEAFNRNQLDYLQTEGELKEHLLFLKDLSKKRRLSIDNFKGNIPLISLKNIQKTIDLGRKNVKLNSLTLANLKIESVKLDFQLEQSSEKKILDYIELKASQVQTSLKDDEYENRLGVRVSFNLPFFEGNNTSLNEKALERLEGKYKARLEKRQAFLNYNLLTRRFNSTIKSIELINKSSHLKEAKKYLRIFRKRKSSSPLKLLAFNEIIMEANLRKTQLELEAYNSYVDILRDRGVLGKHSTKNLLNYRILKKVVR